VGDETLGYPIRRILLRDVSLGGNGQTDLDLKQTS